MKQFKPSYPVDLKPLSGFCMTPFEIIRQADEARRVTGESFVSPVGEDQERCLPPRFKL